jgi:4-hydroxymandelate oxidase
LRRYRRPVDAAALEAQARELIAPDAFDYFSAGAEDGATLRDNLAAWRRIRLLPHVLRDVSSVDTSTEILGSPMSLPILIAPMAAQRLAHADGEAAMARAAAETGTVMVVSTMATVRLEDVAEAGGEGRRWFQLYVHRERGITVDLLERARASGYEAIVLTVDVPVLSRRRKDEINRFELPEGVIMENVEASMASLHGSGLAEYSNVAFEPALTPDDIGWVRSISKLPVVVKGILRADDAVLAVDAGADAVVVSNHGGRQLDGAIASADALPAVADAIDGRVPVLVDGGIRGGYDVVKAIALGANAVLIGRPFLWGLALDGSAGAVAVMEELEGELKRSMALCGARSIPELGRDLIADAWLRPTSG